MKAQTSQIKRLMVFVILAVIGCAVPVAMGAVPTNWGTAELIETVNTGDAEDPQVAVDSAGNAVAVWDQSDGTRDNIWSNRYERSIAFTYQGRLLDDNTAADGMYDLQFKLYHAPYALAGVQIGPTIDADDVDVVDGYFIAELDFGGNVFTGQQRWLEIAVRPYDSTNPNDFVALSPLQPISPTPYASYAQSSNWNNLANMPADFADGVDDTGIGVETDPQVGTLATGDVPRWDGSALASGLIRDNGNLVGIGDEPYSNRKLYVYTDTYEYAVFGKTDVTSGWQTAVKGHAGGNTTDGSYGVYGTSTSDAGANLGVYGCAVTSSTGNNYGVYGYAYNDGTGNAWAGFFQGDGYFTGNVGIGTNMPDATLQVHTDGSNWNITETEGDFKIGDSSYRLKIGVATGGGGAGDVYMRSVGGSNKLKLGSGTSTVLTVSETGVGIGTTSPDRKLHISDVMRLEPRATAPSSPSEGDIYYSSTLHSLMVYNGTTWVACF